MFIVVRPVGFWVEKSVYERPIAFTENQRKVELIIAMQSESGVRVDVRAWGITLQKCPRKGLKK
jgi:hypothetical protein